MSEKNTGGLKSISHRQPSLEIHNGVGVGQELRLYLLWLDIMWGGGQCGRNPGFSFGMLITEVRGNLSPFSKIGRTNRDFKATF